MPKLRFGVLIFPGSNGDHDALHMLTAVMGQEAEPVWHGARQVRGFDALVLPGGFSYGDYLRCGAIARFAPVMDAVRDFAAAGGPVLGICNGFQILTEAHLLPGALLRNAELSFACRWVHVRTEPGARSYAVPRRDAPGTVWRLPIAHGEGCYYADPATLREIEANGQIVLRYSTPERRGDAGGEPQRIDRCHRRGLQRGGQCARPDAPPRTGGRGADRRRRRAAPVRRPDPGAGPGGARCAPGP